LKLLYNDELSYIMQIQQQVS